MKVCILSSNEIGENWPTKVGRVGRVEYYGTGALLLSLFTDVRGRSQAVEEVSIELHVTTNRSRNAPKSVCSVADFGVKAGTKGVFQQHGILSKPEKE